MGNKTTIINKTIYFVSEKEVSDNEYLTGLKDITIYKIENNIPKSIATIRSASDDLGVYFKTSSEEVQDYLEEFEPKYVEWGIEQL